MFAYLVSKFLVAFSPNYKHFCFFPTFYSQNVFCIYRFGIQMILLKKMFDT